MDTKAGSTFLSLPYGYPIVSQAYPRLGPFLPWGMPGVSLRGSLGYAWGIPRVCLDIVEGDRPSLGIPQAYPREAPKMTRIKPKGSRVTLGHTWGMPGVNVQGMPRVSPGIPWTLFDLPGGMPGVSLGIP